MAIDKSGKWWVGSATEDLEEYLRAFTAERHPADRIVHARCDCGHDRFEVLADANAGCVQRRCSRCRTRRFIADSEEQSADANPKALVCPCRSRMFEVSVAFSHREDGTVKWLTVGQRCVKCGVLGAAADWKIDYAPTDHLYAHV